MEFANHKLDVGMAHNNLDEKSSENYSKHLKAL